MEISGPHIVVAGSINMDLVARVLRLPAPGETLSATRWETIPGGKGANQAVAAARMGARVSMIGRVGNDDHGGTLLRGLKDAGVNVRHIAREPLLGSGLAMITVDAQGQNTIVTHAGANTALQPRDIDAAWDSLGDAEALILQFESPAPTVLRAAERAMEQGMPVLFNASPTPPAHLAGELLKRTTILVLNAAEANVLTGVIVRNRRDAESAAEKLIERGPQGVVITLGAQGALVMSADQPVNYLRAPLVKAVDTTAAGDTYIGTLGVCLCEGMDLNEAAWYAGMAATLCVTRPGAQPSIPTRAEVEAFLTQAAAPDAEPPPT